MCFSKFTIYHPLSIVRSYSDKNKDSGDILFEVSIHDFTATGEALDVTECS